MLKSALMKRVMAVLVSLSLVSGYWLPAQAGVITTQQMLQQELAAMDKAALVSALDRDEVRQQLVDLGVDLEVAKRRVAALDDTQIDAMKANLDELPAGAGVLEVLVAVLLVLVILDVVGVTNIFSFINPPAGR